MAAPAQSKAPRATWRLRILRLSQSLVPAIWIIGLAEFRRWPMGPVDYAAIVALLLALQTIRRRMRPNERTLDLGPLTRPSLVATFVGMIAGSMALLLGGLFEAFAKQPDAPHASWWLRTLWHGACAFASAYTGFFARIEAARLAQAKSGASSAS